MATFPTGVQTFPTTGGTEVLGSMGAGTGLSGMLNLLGVDLTATETKLGTGSSVPASNTILYGTGAGTSAWQGLSSAQLLALVSDPTGTGSNVHANTPTIVTPTIASFTNAQHNHTNAAGGGTIADAAITSLSTIKLTNPYKFSVYRSAALTSNNAYTKVAFDTKAFDTGSNFDNVTNFRFTAPVNGFYVFSALVGNTVATGTQVLVSLYKNGSAIRYGSQATAASTGTMSAVNGMLQLNATDYIEVFFIGGAGSTMFVGQATCYFDGYLWSTT